MIPQEICQLKFTPPRQEPVPFMSKWCIDPNAEPVPDQTYDESEAQADPIGPEVADDSAATPQTLYGAPGAGPGDEENFEIPPPPLGNEDAFEQAASSYDEPVFEDAALAQSYGAPRGQQSPNALYGAPQPQSQRSNGGGRRQGPRSGGGPRRRNGGNKGGRRGKIFMIL